MSDPCSRRLVRRKYRQLLDQNDGTVAAVFGLAFLPTMLLLGIGVDYGRVGVMKTRLQTAADSAVLAAGAKSDLTKSAREAIAKNMVLAKLGPAANGANVSVTETEPTVGTYQVRVTASLPTTVMKLANIQSINLAVDSEARNIGASNDQPLEIALALDNTGSMKNDMTGLKDAAKSLVNTVMSQASGGPVKVSIVPYVAVVNPGLANLAHVDTAAQAPWTGDWFKGAWVAFNAGCSQNWGSGSGGGSGAGGSGDAFDLMDMISPFRRIAQELFGVSAAFAQQVTPNTIPTITTNSWTSPVTSRTYRVPVGFGRVQRGTNAQTGGCEWLTNPTTVSNYELFSRLRTPAGQPVAWKGCVEARPSKAELDWRFGVNANHKDYDVTDIAPTSGNAHTLFVPYFAPDEPDYRTDAWSSQAAGAYNPSSAGFRNNYLSDGTIPSSGTAGTTSNWGWTLNQGRWFGAHLLKYRNANAAIITETGGARGYGPNAGCPEPVTRLTNNKSNVISAIDNMNYWDNGGTIVSEGIMWAWRTLSPNAPYADGGAYNTTGLKKVVVLMTDGVNELNDNDFNTTSRNTSNISEYSAYGYLGGNRLANGNSAAILQSGVPSFSKLSTHLDNRLLAACTNAKAAGVKIYTVLFSANITDPAKRTNSENLLRSCASEPAYAFSATNAQGLQNAFGSVAQSAAATPLRLTK